LRLPGGDHLLQRRQRQFGQGLAVIGREADHPADAARALAAHQRIVAVGRRRRIAHQRGEIVGENVGAAIIRITIAGDARVARAQETVGIVRRQRFRGDGLLLALPGALGAVR